MKIIADSNIPYLQEYFGIYGELILKPGRQIQAQDVKDADILLVRSVTSVNQALLEHSKVKFVGSVTAGADHLDTKWLEEVGIEWSVAHGFNAPPVADYVMSTIASLDCQQILPSKPKAAVIGVGNVGSLVVEQMKMLDFDITLCDPLRAEIDPSFNSTPFMALNNLDLISMHVPLTHSGAYPTHHFVNKAFLQKQKPGCVLLNASRGAVIASSDLLEHGKHLHWCFDVWEHEPKINKKILERALIATPHIAGYSVQSKIRGIEMIYRIACEKKIIEPQPISPLQMPVQRLTFASHYAQWQNVLLGIFNPQVVSDVMKSNLLPRDDYAGLFDEMRNQFNYRYEFKFTKIAGAELNVQSHHLLNQLGVRI